MSDCGPVFTDLYPRVSLMTFVIIMGTAWSIGPIFTGFGAGIAQLVERATEKPGAILTRVRVSGAARDFYQSQLLAQTLLRRPYSPPCAIACINLSAHFKNPKHIVWIYRVRQPEFPATDNEVLKNSIHPMAGFRLIFFISYITIL